MRATTMKGQVVDMGLYLAQNERSVAVGNGRMNARGDMVGRGGKVLKTRDEVSREYYEGRTVNTVQKVAINNISQEVYVGPISQAAAEQTFQSPADAVAEAQEAVKASRKTRRIEDNDQ